MTILRVYIDNKNKLQNKVMNFSQINYF